MSSSSPKRTKPDPSADEAGTEGQIRFSDAMTELREILNRLDRDDVDLDQLSGMVERAAELIRLCRRRVVSTEMRVQQIISDLDTDLGDENGNGASPAEPSDPEDETP